MYLGRQGRYHNTCYCDHTQYTFRYGALNSRGATFIFFVPFTGSIAGTACDRWDVWKPSALMQCRLVFYIHLLTRYKLDTPHVARNQIVDMIVDHQTQCMRLHSLSGSYNWNKTATKLFYFSFISIVRAAYLRQAAYRYAPAFHCAFHRCQPLSASSLLQWPPLRPPRILEPCLS